MARRIEHRSSSEWPASRIHEALIDIDYLKERLSEFGGGNTELVEHSATQDGVRFQVRQGVRAEQLPAVARTVVGGDLVIDRSESWRYQQPGHYTGEVAATVPRVPGSITGSMWLHDLPSSGGSSSGDSPAEASPAGGDTGTAPVSEFVVEGSVAVSMPLVGGKLEELFADHVHKLLDDEMRFTSEWLYRHS